MMTIKGADTIISSRDEVGIQWAPEEWIARAPVEGSAALQEHLSTGQGLGAWGVGKENTRLTKGFGFLFPLKSCVSASGGQVSSSLQIPGHSQSARTADHHHHRRSRSSGAGSGGTCGACGSPGSSRPQSWGRSLRRLEADTVLGSLGGTWGRGTWEGAGIAAGSAGRTSRREVSEPGHIQGEKISAQAPGQCLPCERSY